MSELPFYDTLIKKYPKILGKVYPEIGDGWHALLNTMCSSIQSYIDWSHTSNLRDEKYLEMVKALKSGNDTLFLEYFGNYSDRDARKDKLLQDALPSVMPVVEQVIATQIKEKFGGLRFYYDGGDEYVRGMISLAENMSYNICETCGDSGSLQRAGGLLYTACIKHVRAQDIKEFV